MEWFRLHNKILNDPVVQGLSDKHFKMYINILCHASLVDKDGYIGSISETAFALRETNDNVSSCFIALQKAELLVTSETMSIKKIFLIEFVVLLMLLMDISNMEQVVLATH